MLMLLSVHVTSVLFLVLAGNSVLTMGFYWSYTLLPSRPFLCALDTNNAMKELRKAWGSRQYWIYISD